MKSLRNYSYFGAITSIGVGTILLVKGLQGKGVWWAIITGIMVICSGIINIFAVWSGIVDKLELILHKLFGAVIKIFKSRI